VLYVADSGNSSIRAIDLARGRSTHLCCPGRHRSTGPTGLALAGGTLYFSDTNNNLIKERFFRNGGGTVSVVASVAHLQQPDGHRNRRGADLLAGHREPPDSLDFLRHGRVCLAGSGGIRVADGTRDGRAVRRPTGLGS